MQTYQRESKPIQDVYAQVTQLFSSAPDLLEDFKQFLPESAAQAKAQAAAARQQQATEEAAMLSNVRNDPYVAVAQHSQSQTPRNELKMPPVGNFAPPPSASKENKKRRGGAGSQMTGGATATEAPSVTIGHSIKNGNLRSNASKVSGAHLESLKSCQNLYPYFKHYPPRPSSESSATRFSSYHFEFKLLIMVVVHSQKLRFDRKRKFKTKSARFLVSLASVQCATQNLC